MVVDSIKGSPYVGSSGEDRLSSHLHHDRSTIERASETCKIIARELIMGH
jgi:hypothetical protein